MRAFVLRGGERRLLLPRANREVRQVREVPRKHDTRDVRSRGGDFLIPVRVFLGFRVGFRVSVNRQSNRPYGNKNKLTRQLSIRAR